MIRSATAAIVSARFMGDVPMMILPQPTFPPATRPRNHRSRSSRLRVKLSASLLLRRMTPINLFHDTFRPADRIGDGTHRGRNPCSAVILCQLACREDRRGD